MARLSAHKTLPPPCPLTLSLSPSLHPLGLRSPKKRSNSQKRINYVAPGLYKPLSQQQHPKSIPHRAVAACGLAALVCRTEHCFLAFSPDCLPFLLWPEALQDLQKACSKFVFVLLSLSHTLLLSVCPGKC